MRATINRVRRSLAMRGVFGTAAMCAVNLMSGFNPEARRVETAREESDAAFDRQWNVDTGGIFRPGEADVCGENWAHGIRYQAVDAGALQTILRGLEISFPEFTFLDFGSGKGRALLLAADFEFKKIIGVEYCAELNRIAAQNLQRHPAAARRNDIELVTGDAAEFLPPHAPLVMFFYNPFGRAVMSRVVGNVTDSFRTNPRRMIVIYFTPYDADLWQAAGFLNRTQSSPAIFDTGQV